MRAPNNDTLTTVEPVAEASTEGQARVVGLTILFHPDLRRVGEVAPLFSLESGGTRALQRREPLFHKPRAPEQRALETPVVGRAPVELSVAADGDVVVTPAPGSKLKIQGEIGQRVGEAELLRGVLLELNGAVLLLLHFVDDFRQAPPELGFVGDSIGLNQLRREILRVADLDTSVLLLGESGAGKELVARAIHRNSGRAGAELLTVNLAALPGELAASALFGHRRGAFTGALSPHEGYFLGAHGGSLFLDEVGELPADVQPLLLRALREKEIQPLGASRAQRVDVRVIAATDSNLEVRAEKGSFSSPLLHRLRGYTIHVPALRDRPDDVARLFVHFLTTELSATKEAYRLQEPAHQKRPWLPLQVMQRVVEHAWPGNVAALQNLVRQLAIANRFEKRFRLPAVVKDELGGLSESDASPSAARREERASKRPRQKPRELADAVIAETLARHGYNVTLAASELGVSQSWLTTRMDNCQGVRKAQTLKVAEIKSAAERFSDLPSLARQLRVSEHGLKLRLRVLAKQGLLEDRPLKRP